MKISGETSFKLKQLFLIILYWVTMVRVVVVLEVYGLEGDAVKLADMELFSILQQNMIAATLSGLALGLLTGLSELFFFSRYFRNKSFIRLILAKLLVYFIWIFFISVFAVFIYQKYYRGMDNLDSARSVISMINTNGFYHLLILGMLLSMGINFLLIMQNKIGIGTFGPILTGKYYRPREEERIFLFLDLKSSTRMAEKLGHAAYSKMIQACYEDLTSLVIRYRGIVYQFVGDEAVITWKTNRKENFANSIRLFFAFQEVVEHKSTLYQKQFSVVPRFKGAVNAGHVMVAEVGGNIKSEIAFHGDVLNTASRMMELCKFYQKDLIISDSVNHHILPGAVNAEIKLQGEIQLRGKKRKVNVFSVSSREMHKMTSTNG